MNDEQEQLFEEIRRLVIHKLNHKSNEQVPTSHFIHRLVLVGSRLYQCSTNESDYDFLCVCNHNTPYFSNSMHLQYTHHDHQIEVNIYHIDFFYNCLIRQYQHLLPMMIMMNELWKGGVVPMVTMNWIKFKKTLLFDVGRNWQKARRSIQCGNIQDGKKNISHAFRKIHFALQLLTRNQIVDFTCDSNVKHNEIMMQDCVEWKDFEQLYSKELNDQLHSIKHFGLSTIETIEREDLWKHIQQHTIHGLTRHFSIHVERLFDSLPLLLLSMDEQDSPSIDVPIVQSCVSTVIITELEHVISRTHSSLVQLKSLSDLPWQSDEFELLGMEIQEKLDGLNIQFFYYNDQWYTYTTTMTKPRYTTIDTTNYKLLNTSSSRCDDIHEQMMNSTYMEVEHWNRRCHLFKEYQEEIKQDILSKYPTLDHNCCYTFEFMHENSSRIFINRDTLNNEWYYRLIYVYDLKVGREIDIYTLECFREITPPRIVLKKRVNHRELKESILSLNGWKSHPMECEGYILVNKQYLDRNNNYRRMNLQTPQFKALKSLMDWYHVHENTRRQLMLEFIRYTFHSEGCDKLLKHLPITFIEEFERLYHAVHNEIQSVVNTLTKHYSSLITVYCSSSVEFAMECKKRFATDQPLLCSALLEMKKWNHNTGVDYIQDVTHVVPSTKLLKLMNELL